MTNTPSTGTDRLYLRISRDTEVSGSVDRQRTVLLGVARPGAVEYADESVSGGRPFAERPAGARLLRDLAEGDRLLVTKADRASRSTRDLLTLVQTVQDRGASVVFVEQPDLNTGAASGRLMLTILAAVAEMELDLIRERRTSALAAYRAEGRWAVGKAPFGLQSVPNPNGRGLVLRPHPEEGPALRAAVAAILDGTTTQRAAAEALGITESALGKALRNPRLRGVLDPKAAEPRVDPAQALFTAAEWARIADHLDRPAKAWTADDGIGAALVCEACGARLYRQRKSGERQDTYRCAAKHAPGVTAPTVMAHLAEAHVESDYLATAARLPVLEAVVVSSSVERDEALALARFAVDQARAAQDAATTPDEEDAADEAYRAARRALREAEALVDETRVEYRPTGETGADVWERSTPAERAALLAQAGPWSVRAGRGLPIAAKVRRLETEEDALRGQLD